MPLARPFAQIDVFSAVPCAGNPVAVVLDGQGLDAAAMQRFARWTNLSETTFLLPPTEPGADYHVRIWTPIGELPFAGHPTLGSCWAWLAAGGVTRESGHVVQQSGVGLVTVRRDGARLAFAAPPRRRTGPLEPELLQRIVSALHLDAAEVLHHQWVDNGPGWCAVMLRSAEQVLDVKPDWAALGKTKLGLVGRHAPGHEAMFEVRAFAPGLGIDEDPVTGSLNAGLALWLIGAGLAPQAYVAAQGAALGRAGRVQVQHDGETTWIGGDVVALVEGTITL